MLVSHRKIEQAINEKIKTITDQELFTSSAFHGYLMDFIIAVTRQYKRRIELKLIWDVNTQQLAYTDNQKIVINAANAITLQMPNRVLKSDSILGLLAHEAAHVLFTDFEKLKKYHQGIQSGYLYPIISENRKNSSKQLLEIFDFLKDGTEKQRIAFYHTAFTLINILEDVYVEDKMCQKYPGSIAYSIQLNNVWVLDSMPSILKQIQEKHYNYSIMCNLIIQYCLGGDVNNLGDYEGEHMQLLFQCIPIIDGIRNDENTLHRMRAVNDLLVILWAYVKEMIEQYLENEEKKPDANQGNLGEQLQEQIATSIMPMGSSIPVQETEKSSFKPDVKGMAQLRCEINRKLEKTNEIWENNNGKIERNILYAGSNNTGSAQGIQKALNEIGREFVYLEQEFQLKEALQQQAMEIRYGNAHKGIKIVVNRMVTVPETYIHQYEQVAEPLHTLANAMVKQLKPILRDSHEMGKLSGYFTGRNIHIPALVQNDVRIFYKNKLPLEKDLAVAVLIDQSGSMSGERIHIARAASIALYQFCYKLNVPVMITGHNSNGKNVAIYAYAEFDSIDNKDRFRLMDMNTTGCNRDGAAIRYSCECLLKRPEQKKLFLLISDGLPNAEGYRGTEAEADLRGIKKEYTNKGILFFVSAIGDDSEAIKRIYGNSYLDMTNLQKLPRNLVRLVSGYLK